MTNKVDLHLHTYCSDGAESPSTVVQRAKASGLSIIAISDHDGTSGIDEAEKAAECCGIKMIRAIEITAKFEDEGCGDFPADTYRMHILGYGIDHNDPELKKLCEDVLRRRADRNVMMQQAFAQRGIYISDDELLSYSPNQFAGKVTFAKILVDRGLCRDLTEAFHSKEYLACPEILAIKRDRIDVQTCSRLIHGSGGSMFLAHPLEVQWTGSKEVRGTEAYFERIRHLLKCLKGCGLDGLECCYPTHNKEDLDRFCKMADEFDLLKSRGSDDHGEGIRPVKKMGEFEAEIDPEELKWLTQRY